MHTQATKRINDAVVAAGGKAYFVGGVVRDVMIDFDIVPKDRDMLVTGIQMDKLINVLALDGCHNGVELVGAAFGVLKVTAYNETVDVAIPRTEKSTGAGHRDFAVVVDHTLPVEHDLARRDFTMNAIAINAETLEIIDPFNGCDDIKNKLVRCVGDANARFVEDPLRMLRAVRFMNRLGFVIQHETANAIAHNAQLLLNLSAERVFDELSKILMHENPAYAFKFMENHWVLDYVIPEWLQSVNFNQMNEHHDLPVNDHVLKALGYAASKNASLQCRWAVLLHDIAKPETFTVDSLGRGHFYGHEDKGAEQAKEIMTRLKAPADMIEGVARVVKEHLRLSGDPSDKVLRRYKAELGDLVEDGLMCREADGFAHVGGDTKVRCVQVYRERIEALDIKKGFDAADLALRGDEIMKIFAAKGKMIGTMKNLATEAVIDGTLKNDRDAIVEFLKGQGYMHCEGAV